jgi:hypothetical protein
MLNGEEGKVTGGVYTTLKAVWLLSVPQADGPQFAVDVAMNQFTPAFLGSFATVTYSVSGWPPALIVELLLVMVVVKPGIVTLNTSVSPLSGSLTELANKVIWLIGKGGVVGAFHRDVVLE